ncbi:MAG TPA: M4 family metallopeptidase [Kofleriaceae bacterium]|nr:M4 family metallopeptidase [Kofleriaceae bacterium]
MNARALFSSLIALTAGCTAGGLDGDDPGAGFRVDRMEVTGGGAPYFMDGALGRVAAPIADVDGATAALAPVLPAIADALRVPAADLVATRVERDALGMTHVRLAQRKEGLRVVGGDVIVHLGADGTVRSVTSTARDRALPAVPSLVAAAAARLAVQATPGNVGAHESELVYVISTADDELYLAWEVLVTGADGVLLMDYVYVDASTGRVVDRRPQVFTARNRRILDNQGQPYPVLFPPPPVIGTENSAPTDMVGRLAYDNTGATYDCFQTLFQRDSYDGSGATLTSVVHATFQTPNGGTTGNNAAWVQLLGQMVYGDGDGTFMTPLAGALDVTAHELTHAVTSATANLAYQNESGALNEGLSDILAAVCESWKDGGVVSADTWLVGEDIFTPAIAGDALRYMDNPTADKDLYPPQLGGSRDYYPERYTGTDDNGGVHLNSGIPNLAFHLLVAGGTHPRSKTAVTVPGIGMEQAGHIFYRALTQRFTANTNLAQARTLTEAAAQDLYPGCTKNAVGMAWAAVGGGTAPPADATPPTTEITSPADGAKVVPGFQVEVNAADDQCVLKVELSIDGALVETKTAPPFTFMTDANLAPGMHTIQVTTYDVSNTSTDTATVTIGGGGGGDVCTVDDQCPDGEICVSGHCQVESDPPGCGCATDSRRGAAGSLALLLATAFALRRRRR